MSTGISISSINRIKELAEEKKYAQALEILDTQNIDKSINPQFLKISGEIYRENKRYYDSRKYLLKAHQMAPQGLRIIHEIIQLYLELGYFDKAEKYYEQYMFYTTPDDQQKEFVEYIYKKAKGAEIKELAAILIPILEQLPDDRWSFEAVLLYDKMDRKDKALDECRHILENFKESNYIDKAIAYINDKLSVDEYFDVYPKEQQKEDVELFGDLIEQEEKILQADHLMMYPPEAKIMVEVEDKNAIDVKPAKEKKPKKSSTKKKSKREDEPISDESVTSDTSKVENSDSKSDAENLDKESDSDSKGAQQDSTDEVAENKADDETAKNEATELLNEEVQLQKEREAALDRLLSKKIDADKIKESAMQMAKAVKEIDTTKAKDQVKSVAEVVKTNVSKATNVLGEAVGVKSADEPMIEPDSKVEDETKDAEEVILDGIIESVLVPPKKTVGQVVTNEELDSLVPDTLEAMSVDEVEELELKRVEAEKLELEALEAQVKLEEERKAKTKKFFRKNKSDEDEVETDDVSSDSEEQEIGDLDEVSEQSGENATSDNAEDEESLENSSLDDKPIYSMSDSEFAKLRQQFIDERDQDVYEEEPLENLGYISVVQSDVDSKMEEELPDTADILHQMIDNKEFYTGENSNGFESQASYNNHGFEIEDFDFEEYRDMEREEDVLEEVEEDKPPYVVKDIYTEEEVVDFEVIAPEEELEPIESPSGELFEIGETNDISEKVEQENNSIESTYVTASETAQVEQPEAVETTEEPMVVEEPEQYVTVETTEEPMVVEEPEQFVAVETTEEPMVVEEPEQFVAVETTEEPMVVEEPEQFVAVETMEEPMVAEEPEQFVMVESIEEPQQVVPEVDFREQLRVRILLSDNMIHILSNLKESR